MTKLSTAWTLVAYAITSVLFGFIIKNLFGLTLLGVAIVEGLCIAYIFMNQIVKWFISSELKQAAKRASFGFPNWKGAK